MKYILKKSKVLILIFILMLVTMNSHFFENIYKIYKTNLAQRVENAYGFCQQEGYGFTKQSLKLIETNTHILILNDLDISGINWIFENNYLHFAINQTDQISNYNFIIYLNYNSKKNNLLKKIGNNFVIHENKYQILLNEENCFLLKKR